ncbi:hypothetical protein DRN98_02490 [Methanosarcinales archaeon]|uniref:Transcription regulator, AsnC-type n=1 Tax=Candidatus Syntropharchaeum caldarium TaxID=1838285 RepID=A0A1F2P939_9EURY|nr:MAG: Transcription regulator, AsnC-type [Candidatus Syntrophoarchaeum caldarius]RLG34464.1 MAG: hypothetical protein DRN98_02490 [Methanosarcinales archaeon]
MKLDELDRKILMAMQQNGRLSFRKIATQIGTTTATVSERVRRLEESGVLKGYTVVLDHTILGVNTMISLVEVGSEYDPRDVALRIKELDGVCCIYQVTGDVDLIVKSKCFGQGEECATYLGKLNQIEGVTRVKSHMVLRILKEESTVDLDLQY